MTSLRTTLLLTTGMSMLAAVTPARAAQPASAEQQAQAADAAQIAPSTVPKDVTAGEDIVVTAQKRAQLLVDVPQSISVVSGAALEKQHANNFSDYLKLVPGLQLNESTPGEARLIVRGLNAGGVASTVGIYVDETPFGSSSGLVNGGILAGDFDTFDLNRIEVLRGPQGTLYGASSLSGVLRFITNLPSTDRVIVRGRAGIETVDGGDMGYFGNLVVNVPLGQTLALRASGTYRKVGGFIDSIGTAGSDVQKNINGSNSFGGRASLLFKPSDGVSIRLNAIAQNIEADAPSVVEADPVTLRPLYGRLSQSQYVPQFSNIKYRVYNATGSFDLGFAELTSSTSFSTQNRRQRIDLTAGLSGFIGSIFGPNELSEPQDTNDRKFTQEVRLSSQTRVVDWLVGGYYTKEKGLVLQDINGTVPGTSTPIPSLTPLAHASLTSKYREIAGFADGTFHLSKRFDVEAGGRYSENKQSSHQISSGAFGGADLGVVPSSENVFTFSVAPKYKFNKNAAIYARVAKGFRPGGPNVVPPAAPIGFPTTYKSDSIISYEAGVKAETPDHRFSIDAAAFHIDWKDIQLASNFGGYGLNANGGTAKSDGLEFTATARPVRGLNLSLNGAYTHARLTQDTPPEVGGKDGDRLPFSPKLSVGLNGDYSWLLSTGIDAHVGASWRHLSNQKGSFDPDYVALFGRRAEIRAYSVVDLDAGLDFGRFSLDAYVKNLNNSHGVTDTNPYLVLHAFPAYANGALGTGIIRPRTIGLSLTASY